MHDEISRLQADADAALASAPIDPVPGAAPGPAPGAPVRDEWGPFIQPAVTVIAAVALPQWELTAQESAEFSSALADCLNQLFPDGLNGKYACYFRLAACAGAIVVTRAVQHGGKLPGFGPKRPAPIEGEAQPAGPQV